MYNKAKVLLKVRLPDHTGQVFRVRVLRLSELSDCCGHSDTSLDQSLISQGRRTVVDRLCRRCLLEAREVSGENVGGDAANLQKVKLVFLLEPRGSDTIVNVIWPLQS